MRINPQSRLFIWLKNRRPFSSKVLLCAVIAILALPASLELEHWGGPTATRSSHAATSESSINDRSLPSPGKSVTRELAPRATHQYDLQLETGQYLQLSFESQGLRASIQLDGPVGNISRIKCPDDGIVELAFISDSSSTYRLQIVSTEDSDSGLYDLSLEERRPARAQDDSIVKAIALNLEAIDLLNRWKESDIRAAIEKLKTASELFREAGDVRNAIRSLKKSGDAYQLLGEYKNALPPYEEALSLVRPKREPRVEAQLLNEIAYVHINQGDNSKALHFCSRALSLAKLLDKQTEARALNNLGEMSYGLGKLQESLEYYNQALPHWRESRDRQGQALTLLNMGYTYSDLGQMDKALDFFNQSLRLWEMAQNKRGKAITLTALGRFYSRTGEGQKALKHFDEAMQIIEALGARAEQGRILTGMGYVYGELGDSEHAVDFYNQAFFLFNSVGDYSGEVASLYDAGRSYFALANYEKALECFNHAYSLSQTASDRRLQSFELREIARIHSARGETAKALSLYSEALSFWRSQNDSRASAETLNLIGAVFEKQANWQKAKDYYNEALVLSRKAQFKIGEVASLYNLARSYQSTDNLEQAKEKIEEALKVVETLRWNISSQALRDSYFAEVRQQYDLYIDILMQLHKREPTDGFEAAAFNVSERARARSLLELLQEARADINKNVNPELLSQEKSLREALDVNAERHMQLLASHNNAEAERVARKIDELTSAYDRLKAVIRSDSPRYAALTQPQPVELHQIQHEILDDNSILLEYALGENRSYLWAVSRTKVSSFELPGREELESAAHRFHELLVANQIKQGESPEQHQQRTTIAIQQISAETHALSKQLLGPVANELGTKRLLIVADGALQHIPFQALTSPLTEDTSDPTPLIFQHEIVNEPSASTLISLKNLGQPRPKKLIAMLADPVFEADDPRITSPKSEKAQTLGEQVSDVHRAFRDVDPVSNSGRIQRLFGTREEADRVMNLVPGGLGKKALGFEASRATATSPELGDYAVVHFATHGLTNNQHPELSGIILSLFDERGQAQDGFLRLHDIYNMKLPVDLVVLSACETGLGKDIKGEGLVGLTRGFMYAGASGVIASLWKVDDEATAELMQEFYTGLIQNGLTPADALRQAQLSLWKQKRWHEPYYWAAFVIQGEYNDKIIIPGKTRSLAIPFAIGCGILLIVALFLLRRKLTFWQTPSN